MTGKAPRHRGKASRKGPASVVKRVASIIAVAILVLAGTISHQAAAVHAVGFVSMAKAQETIFFESIRVMDDSPYVERMPVMLEVTNIVLGEFYLENPPHIPAGHQDIVADNFGFIRNIKAFPSGIGANLRAKVPFDFSGRQVTSVSDHYFDDGILTDETIPNLIYPIRVNRKMGALHCFISYQRISRETGLAAHYPALSSVNEINQDAEYRTYRSRCGLNPIGKAVVGALIPISGVVLVWGACVVRSLLIGGGLMIAGFGVPLGIMGLLWSSGC